MTVGLKIKSLRKEHKLTQSQLAAKANLSRSYLADIERNRYNPSLSTLESIAGALGVQVADILVVENTNKEVPDDYKEKDIANRINELITDLKHPDKFFFLGEPISLEAADYLIESFEHLKRQTPKINRVVDPKSKSH
ncbi:helix-turn-helix transcriptional regulator [Bacillus mexicanus]|uniref:helix-turn-helix domain-containing protein n=1 Tax=Bacillus mexicanus TaxID=2834415 RepID=UPI003D1E1AB1